MGPILKLDFKKKKKTIKFLRKLSKLHKKTKQNKTKTKTKKQKTKNKKTNMILHNDNYIIPKQAETRTSSRPIWVSLRNVLRLCFMSHSVT